jgi:hypothetical protein
MKTIVVFKKTSSGNYRSINSVWYWICGKFINNFCGITSDKVKVTISNKRIHNRGWMKLFYKGPYEMLTISNKITKYIASGCINEYFEKVGTNVLWFKIEAF